MKVPILFSVETLRSLGALIDFEHDLIVFRHLSNERIIQLERSSSGHQLLPLAQDWHQGSQKTNAPGSEPERFPLGTSPPVFHVCWEKGGHQCICRHNQSQVDGLEEVVKGCDESVDVVSAVVCETSGNLQNTSGSSSDDHSASVSPAVAAATVYRDQLALGDPPTSLIDVDSHASTYQGAVDCRADQHGRSTTLKLDSSRTQDACGGASSGAWAVRKKQEEPLSFAHDDHRSEQGQEGEEKETLRQHVSQVLRCCPCRATKPWTS